MRTFETISKGTGWVLAGLVCIIGVLATATIKAADVMDWKIVVLKGSPVKQLSTQRDFEQLATQKVCILDEQNIGTTTLESNFDPAHNTLEPVYTKSLLASFDAVKAGRCGSAVVPAYALDLLGNEKKLFHVIALNPGSVHMSLNSKTVTPSADQESKRADSYENYQVPCG